MAKALKAIVIIVFFLFGFIPLIFSQEQITITSYYPSPFGSYQELRADRMSVGTGTYRTDSLTDGQLFVQGNVGIGTTSPAAGNLLEVNGNLQTTSGNVTNDWDVGGNVTAGSADIAGNLTANSGAIAGPDFTIDSQDVCLEDGTNCDRDPNYLTDVTINNLTVTTSATVGTPPVAVCLKDGTNCPQLEVTTVRCEHAMSQWCEATCPVGYLITGGGYWPGLQSQRVVDSIDFNAPGYTNNVIVNAYSGGGAYLPDFHVPGSNSYKCGGWGEGFCYAQCARMR